MYLKKDEGGSFEVRDIRMSYYKYLISWNRREVNSERTSLSEENNQ